MSHHDDMGRAFIFIYSKRVILMSLSFLLASCNPFGESSSGVCSSSGENTYKFSGAWKKIYGYESPRSAAELENDFHLLMIEPGDRLCEAGVSNSVTTGANYRALFLNNVNKRTVDVQYDEDNQPAPDAEATTIKYSFSGSCGDTQLTFRYPDGAVEKYELFNSTVELGSCDPE
jgi:hypothetical protein